MTLCNTWWDEVRRDEPLKVLIVRPLPAYTLDPRVHVHLVLEQGLNPQRAALHFTAAFHGDSRLQQIGKPPTRIRWDEDALLDSTPWQRCLSPPGMFTQMIIMFSMNNRCLHWPDSFSSFVAPLGNAHTSRP